MMYCKYCGKEISDDASYCPHCGAKLKEREENLDAFFEDSHGTYWKNGYESQFNPNVETNVGVGWCILAFVSPLAGFITALIFRKTRPKTARMCILIGLASIILSLLLQQAGF